MYRASASSSKRSGSGSSRAHSTDSRKVLHPMAAARSSASSGWAQKSHAMPEGSTRPLCSQVRQLFPGSPSPL